jgi:hypothetical protein
MSGHGADHAEDPATPEPVKTSVVTIRTPAGLAHNFQVRHQDRVDQTVQTAVEYFVARSQLAAGNYGLVIIREAQPAEMPHGARLADFNVADGDVLFLINNDPQVDA